MATVFTRIIEGELPGTFIHRDEHCVVIMSINPISTGHVLVVPVREVDHWIDLPSHLVTHLFTVAHHIGQAQRAAFGCKKVGLIIAGFEVPHAHIHVIPTNSMSDLDFANAAASITPDELEAAAQAMRDQIAS